MELQLERFLDVLSVERGFSDNTIAAYQNDLSQFSAWLANGDRPADLPRIGGWESLSQAHVDEYVEWMRAKGTYAPSSIARKIAACAPLSIKATLTSAHQYVDPVEADALSKLGAQYAALYRTEDFIEGRRAEAEGRLPKYQGK